MIVTRNPYQQYRTQGVMTASPAELIVMLYDGLLKHIQLSLLAMEEGRVEDANRSLIRGQEIIEELMGSLDMEYDIAHQLYDIYEFCHRALEQANMTKDPAHLDGIADIFSSFREAWATLAKQNRVHLPMAAED